MGLKEKTIECVKSLSTISILNWGRWVHPFILFDVSHESLPLYYWFE